MTKWIGAAVVILGTCASLLAQDIGKLKYIGKLSTLAASEIKESRWSIGGETLDRDYADYHAYKSYLGPLGAKRIRLQGGWAKCEKVRGKYEFAWLDEIVNDALKQGVQPWLQVSYGNPIYPGGGEAALAGGIPTSDEALHAWDNWVEACVNHFKDRVTEWEIWNEPDLSKKFNAPQFARFHERTASVIKKAQPSAQVISLALCCINWNEYADTVLNYLQSVNKLNLIDIVSFHGYAARPEDTYPRVAELRKVFSKYGLQPKYWQGENGAPSTPKALTIGALREHDWTELTQAKWNLRRVLGDMGNDVDVTNLFQISEMHYASGDHMTGINSKGLLKTNPDKSIAHPKLAYGAYQHVTTLFSEKIERIKDLTLTGASKELALFAYRKPGKEGGAITLWFAQSKPEEAYASKSVSFNVNKVSFKEPVLIDLIDGKVYALSKDNYSRINDTCTFKNIPVADYPMAIVDKSWIKISNQ